MNITFFCILLCLVPVFNIMAYSTRMKRRIPRNQNVQRKRQVMARRPRYLPLRRMPRTTDADRQQVFNLSRECFYGTWNFGTATTGDFWRYYEFNVASFPWITRMITAFDEYKVNAFVVTLRPSYTSVDNSSTTPVMNVSYTIDPGTTTNPSGVYSISTLNDMMGSGVPVTKTADKPIVIYWKPKVLTQAWAASTASGVEDPGWYRSTDTSVNHRGVHIYLHDTVFSGTSNAKFDVHVKAYMSFRNPK